MEEIADIAWRKLVSGGKIKGADERAFKSNLITTVRLEAGSAASVVALGPVAAEVVAVVAGVVAADIIDNIIDRKYPEPGPTEPGPAEPGPAEPGLTAPAPSGPGKLGATGGPTAPIPPHAILKPHRGGNG